MYRKLSSATVYVCEWVRRDFEGGNSFKRGICVMGVLEMI